MERIRRLAWSEAGVERSGEGLDGMLRSLEELSAPLGPAELGGEGRNLLLAARLVATGALVRTESRGAHHRTDHPATDPRWRRHLALELEGDGTVTAAPLPLLETAPETPALPGTGPAAEASA